MPTPCRAVPRPVGGVDERRARRRDLGHKGVRHSCPVAFSTVQGAVQPAVKLPESVKPVTVGRARGIHRDAKTLLLAAPAQVGGVDERRARRVELATKASRPPPRVPSSTVQGPCSWR